MIFSIHFLRGIASLFVFIYHIYHIIRLHNDFTFIEFEFFHIGVDIFFIISGFIMIAVLSKSSSFTIDYILQFAKSRFIRIFPQYFIVTIIIFIGYVYVLNNPRDLGYLDLIKSLLFIPFMSSDGLYPVLGVGWTLNYEVLFYCTIVFSLFLFRGYYIFCVLFSFFALVIISFFTSIDSVVIRFWSNPIIIEFLYGMLIGLLYFRHRQSYIVVFLYSICLVAFTLAFKLFSQELLLSVFVVSIMLLLESNKLALSAFKFKPFIFLGTVSYSFYLVHQPIISFLSKGFVYLGEFSSINSFLVFILFSFSLSVITSLVLDKLVSHFISFVSLRVVILRRKPVIS